MILSSISAFMNQLRTSNDLRILVKKRALSQKTDLFLRDNKNLVTPKRETTNLSALNNQNSLLDVVTEDLSCILMDNLYINSDNRMKNIDKVLCTKKTLN